VQSRVFFFQAEDGIRDKLVTGVQTCALPISAEGGWPVPGQPADPAARAIRLRQVQSARVTQESAIPVTEGAARRVKKVEGQAAEIGRASCRARGEVAGGDG